MCWWCMKGTLAPPCQITGVDIKAAKAALPQRQRCLLSTFGIICV